MLLTSIFAIPRVPLTRYTLLTPFAFPTAHPHPPIGGETTGLIQGSTEMFIYHFVQFTSVVREQHAARVDVLGLYRALRVTGGRLVLFLHAKLMGVRDAIDRG